MEQRVDEILEGAVAYYEAVLWDEAPRVAARLMDGGVQEATLRRFQVGYAPNDWSGLLRHLAPATPDAADLVEAGIGRPTERGLVRVYFRNRVMFPVRDRGGRILGFAAMATSTGASWAAWITSPEGRYRKDTALFGIDAAAQAIARTGRALVLGDCLDVLRLREGGEQESIAVIRSPLKEGHLRQLATELGVSPDALEQTPTERDELGDVLEIRPASNPVGPKPATPEGPPRERRSAPTLSRITPDRERPLRRAERGLLVGCAIALGVGIPLAWVAITSPDASASSGPGTDFVIAIGSVVVTYIALMLAAAVIAGWKRSRSRARRMRAPWEHGMTEWQPSAWTYHRFEEVLIGAALVSLITSVVLFVVVGGFGG